MDAEAANKTELTPLIKRSECEFIWEKLHKGWERKPSLGEFIIKPESSSIGFLGQYFQLILFPAHDDDENEGKNADDRIVKMEPEKLFVKTLPHSNSELCEYVQKKGILKKEMMLYATLLKELRKFLKTGIAKKMWCGECYYIRDDLFVMQHLSEIGYEASRSNIGQLKPIEIENLLQCLASMHASSIAYEVNTGTNIGAAFEEVLHEITVSPSESYFTTGLKAITAVIKHHPLYQGNEEQYFITNHLEQSLKDVYAMANPSGIYRNVFCHRDPWAGNVFFNRRIGHSANQPKDQSSQQQAADVSSDHFAAHLSPALLMDFQTCRYCPAAIDVIFALYMNLGTADRRQRESDFLSCYYERFADELNALSIKADTEMSWLEFSASYQQLKLLGSVYKAIATTVLKAPNDYLSNVKLQAPQHYYRYLYVDRTSDVLLMMQGSEEFRVEMNDCVADVMTVLGQRRKSAVS